MIKNFLLTKEILWLLVGLVIVNGLLILWAYYDHGLPVYDTACHILGGFSAWDLFKHMHFHSLDWWKSLMTINPLYPPFVYIVYGLLKLVLGPQHWVDVLAHLVFANILFFSMYGLGKSIFNDYVVAVLSGIIVLVYPGVFVLAHYDLLDLPALSMVTLALACLMYWHKKPSFINSILVGITFTLATLTKNNCLAFLITPFIFLFGYFLYSRNWPRLRQLAFSFLVALVIGLPWLILGAQLMIKTVSICQNMGDNGSFADRFVCYLVNLPGVQSVFLSIIFVISLLICPKHFHRAMLLLWGSAIGGIVTTALFNWPPLVRYILPVTILTALYSSFAFKALWLNPVYRPLSILFAVLTGVALLENSFTPYPFPRLKLPTPVEIFLGISPERDHRFVAPGGISMYPTSLGDLGTSWVLNTIQMHPEHTKQKLTILPDTEEVSLSTYLYLIRQKTINLEATNLRNYTLMGDQINFSADKALRSDWYLLCTNGEFSSLSHFADKKNKDTYMLCCDFIKHSKYFKLIGRYILPSGTQLELYAKSASLN